MPQQAPLTRLLEAVSRGEEGAADVLFDRVYSELRELAGRQPRGPSDSLHPTDLVHETYLRLVQSADRTWHNRRHFVRVAAAVMRHVVIDHVRRRSAAKRGAGRVQASAMLDSLAIDPARDDELLAVHEALDDLAQHDERAARVVTMRFFLGLTEPEIADTLEITDRTVRRDWVFARSWLARHLGRPVGGDEP